MMFILVVDICNDIFEMHVTDGKGPIACLPREFSGNDIVMIDPMRRFSFE